MTKLRAIFAMLAFVAAVGLRPAGAWAEESAAVTDANVAQRIESAKTAADHQALASYFNSQAAAAADVVKKHQDMLAAFKKADSAQGKAIGRSGLAWQPHCDSLIKSSKAAQKDYQMLAQEQQKLAAQAGK